MLILAVSWNPVFSCFDNSVIVCLLVVGLFSSEGTTSITDMMGGSPNILIPYTTALKMNNQNVVKSFTVYLADGMDSEKAADQIEATMDAMFSYEDDCFSITTMSSVEDTMASMLSMMSALLAGIASIALVVGGIGIMNMMLTTPTIEPTPTLTPITPIEIKPVGNVQFVDGVWYVTYQTPQDQVTFEWTQLSQASAYEVQIVDVKDQVLYTSTETVAGTQDQGNPQPSEDTAALNMSLSLPASTFGAEVCIMTVKAVMNQQILTQDQISFVLTQDAGGPPGGGFPGGGRPGGGFPGGRVPGGSMPRGGMPEEDQGFKVTPGEAFANSHSSGSKDMQLYYSVKLTTGEEAMTVLTLDDTQLGIVLDDRMSSFFAAIDASRLILTPEMGGQAWSINALALKTLHRSGIESISLTIGDTSIVLPTDLQMRGAEYGRLSAQGYVSKDYLLEVTKDDIQVSVANRSYKLNENNELVGG